MKEHLITGNVVEGEFQIDKPEPVKGFIVGDKIIYQDGWDILDRVKHSIVKIYEAPIVNHSSWSFGSATDEGLVCVWEKIAITEFEETMPKNLKKKCQYITKGGYFEII